MPTIEEILRAAKEAGASDVHLTVGIPPKMRVNGNLITMDYPRMLPADTLNNPPGMVLLYLGFGSGLSVFMFCGFIKSIPLDIEEAAMIDGCNPLQTFFGVVMPILKPTAITVAILNAMWIWNDYLLKEELERGCHRDNGQYEVQHKVGFH